MAHRVRWLAAPALAAGLLASAAALAQDPGKWSSGQEGFSVTLTPLAYDQVASFYIARGLPQPEVGRYARRCVLAATLRNERKAGAVSFRAGDWMAKTADAPPKPIRTREQWLRAFASAGVPQAARIAFEWAQVPDRHEFEPGDWIQGMLAVPVDRGADFALKLRWTAGGTDHEHWITGLRCP